MRTWQLQEAKNRLSHVVDEALADGPQVITRRGKDVAVLISVEQYRQLSASRLTLSEFLRQSPLADAELELDRDRSPVRDEFTA